MPKPRKFHRTNVLNTTGEVGVHIAVQRTRKGALVRYACATWIDDVGRPRKRSFSIAKYGEHRALSLAVDIRRRVVAELLRPPGPS